MCGTKRSDHCSRFESCNRSVSIGEAAAHCGLLTIHFALRKVRQWEDTPFRMAEPSRAMKFVPQPSIAHEYQGVSGFVQGDLRFAGFETGWSSASCCFIHVICDQQHLGWQSLIRHVSLELLDPVFCITFFIKKPMSILAHLPNCSGSIDST